MRTVGFAGPGATSAWLDRASGAAMSVDDITARLVKQPRDIGLLWQLAERARSSHDDAAERKWLARIEAVDASAAHDEAVKAPWPRAEMDVSDRLEKAARAAAMAHLRKYPADGDEALSVLAAAGADRKTLEAQYARVIAASKPEALNSLVYGALGAGALDGALAAAQ